MGITARRKFLRIREKITKDSITEKLHSILFKDGDSEESQEVLQKEQIREQK